MKNMQTDETVPKYLTILINCVKISKATFIGLLLVASFWLSGCNSREDNPQPEAQGNTVAKEAVANKPGCKSCHQKIKADQNHSFSCTECHGGNNSSSEADKAHVNLIKRPAHPSSMAATCGKCHQEQTKEWQNSSHFTLKNKVNKFRNHFGADEKINSLQEIPEHPMNDHTIIALSDDLLRRQCLRCHVYVAGDDYDNTHRATGCGACHLDRTKDNRKNHSFLKNPGDKQCLSCHYGNKVGSDYYGWYEHDYNWEYRTPYGFGKDLYSYRPYGLEQHQLRPDIHQQKGLVCIDCHSGKELKGTLKQRKCQSCHDWQNNKPEYDNLKVTGQQLILSGKNGKQYIVPQLTNPAHGKYGDKVSCQVCHAQWSFNDSTTHLLRTEDNDLEQWQKLTVQGNSWTENLLEHNLFSDGDEIPIVSLDYISGKIKPGIWLQGYTERRWEKMIIKKDQDNVIKVFRPILDLQISVVDADGNTILDNQKGTGNGMMPYTPHTTGKAGAFYQQRFIHLLDE